MVHSLLLFLILVGVSLTNYQFARISATVLSQTFSTLDQQLTIILPWLGVAVLTSILARDRSSFVLDAKQTLRNKKELLGLFGIVLLGLLAFVLLGVTKNFHAVKYPILFILITPIVEEMIFRGWMFKLLSQTKHSPAFITSLLFSLHHLQYFGYHPSVSAIFQMAYTFVLGILFGLMRKKSGSIYPSLLAHMLINFVSIIF